MVKNMARVLMVVGSRREGNSYHLANILKERLGTNRISADVITPGNQRIYLCTGCMDCDQKGVCDFKDDMEDNIAKIKDAEVIIFISPTRWNTLSGDLKIFMDRLNPLYSTKGLKDKKFISLVIGSKKRNEYSLDGTMTSITSFIEACEGKLIYKDYFDECLNFTDILKCPEHIERVCDNIISILE